MRMWRPTRLKTPEPRPKRRANASGAGGGDRVIVAGEIAPVAAGAVAMEEVVIAGAVAVNAAMPHRRPHRAKRLVARNLGLRGTKAVRHQPEVRRTSVALNVVAVRQRTPPDQKRGEQMRAERQRLVRRIPPRPVGSGRIGVAGTVAVAGPRGRVVAACRNRRRTILAEMRLVRMCRNVPRVVPLP